MQPLHWQDHKVKSTTFLYRQTECRSVAIVIYSGSKSAHFPKQAEINFPSRVQVTSLSDTANTKFPSEFLLNLPTEVGLRGHPNKHWKKEGRWNMGPRHRHKLLTAPRWQKPTDSWSCCQQLPLSSKEKMIRRVMLRSKRHHNLCCRNFTLCVSPYI